MSEKNSKALTGFQVFTTIIRAVLGIGILELGRASAKYAKQDTWISVFLCSIITGLFLAIEVKLCKRFPEDTFLDMIKKIFGNVGFWIMGFFYFMYFFIVTSFLLRYNAEVIKTWFLDKSPYWIIMIVFMLPVTYVSIGGIHTLIRFNENIMLILLPITVIHFIGLPYLRLYNIQPIGDAGIINILKGIPPIFYGFSGCEILLFINPFIQNRETISKAALSSFVFISGITTLITLQLISFFGYEEITYTLYPLIKYLRSFEIPVINRLEFLFVFFATFSMVSTLSLQYFLASNIVQNIIPPLQKKNRITCLFLTIANILLASLSRNERQTIDFIRFLGYTNVLTAGIIPLILLIFSYFKKEKESTHGRL